MKPIKAIEAAGITPEQLAAFAGALAAEDEERFALYAYKTDGDGEVIESALLFVFEDQDAARATLEKRIKAEADESVFYDLERGSAADFEDGDEEEAEGE
jgi:hypothetical protein